MNRVFLAAVSVMSIAAGGGDPARVVDTFAQGGWRRFESTPGTLSVTKDKLRLVDAPGASRYVTASRTFTVDIDATPVFVVKVGTATDRGTVKLIRKEPYDKRVAIDIDRPGLYAVDMRRRFGWRGSNSIETCLYAIGEEADITYEYVGFFPKLTREEEELIRNRNAGGNVRLQVAPFELVALFNSCSLYFKSPFRTGLAVRYRRKGESWLPAFPPVYVAEDGMYRGSIVDLEEDTEYELQVTAGADSVLAEKTFRTWSSQVPVAKTIVLDDTNFAGRLAVKESGSAEGWIRITAKKGFVLRNDRSGPLVELNKVKYVLLEGLTLRGGLKEAVTIRNCEYVRVVNCDIAGWGRTGTQRFDRDGKFYTDNGTAINWDSAILVSRSLGTVIERCYIHDPVSRANSWYYSHPAGPQAVGMDKPRSTVVRYNDFIGSDLHRWNDAIEGAGNYHLDGGFNRDADIYGNLMCFANDDALEIDGGQTNVRVFLNKFEVCLCAVSIQGCMSGPSYVFRNLLVNMGDERGLAGQTIKTSSHANGPSAVSFIFNNTCYGNSADLNLPYNLRIVAKNNIFAGRRAIAGRKRSPQSDCDFNLLAAGQPGEEKHGITGNPGFVDPAAGLFAPRRTSPAIGQGLALPNFSPLSKERVDLGAIPFGSDRVLPARPIPVYLDRYQLMFSADDSKSDHGKSVTASVRGRGFSARYRIAKNDAFDWFGVSPAAGTLEAGENVTFTVRLIPAKLTGRQLYRGAFLVRLENGFSRPVMVYAATDMVPPVKPYPAKNARVVYAEAETPAGGKSYNAVADPSASGGKCILLSGPAGKNPTEYAFRIPTPGKYFVVLRIKSQQPVGSHDSVFFGLDEGPFDRSQLRSSPSWSWSLAAHNRAMSLICLQGFDLGAGKHVLKLAPRESIYIDLIAITDHPGLFEP